MKEFSIQIDNVQRDNANVVDVVKAFQKIPTTWQMNIALADDTEEMLLQFWQKRWQLFRQSTIGKSCSHSRKFIFEEKEIALFDIHTDSQSQDENDTKKWARELLAAEKYSNFANERQDMEDLMNLGQNFSGVILHFPLHRTLANIVKKVAISEACVERAFSKHKRVHTNMRASLKAEKLDDQLFIRYNSENILKISKELVQVEDDIIDWGYYFEPFENDFG